MASLEQIFKQECMELLESFEQGLVNASNGDERKEIVTDLFRSLHTIKGSASMFGFQKISELTHELECLFDEIREGKRILNQELITLSFQFIDIARSVVDSGNENNSKESKLIQDLIFKIKNISTSTNVVTSPITNQILYYINIKPSEQLFLTGNNLLYVIDDLLKLGKLTCRIYLFENTNFNQFNFQKAHTGIELILETNQSVDQVKEQFIFIQDNAKIEIEEFNLLNTKIDVVDLSNFSDICNPFLLKESLTVHLDGISLANVSKGKINEPEKQNHSIRVASYKLDELMSLVSELITTQAQLEVAAIHSANVQLINVVESLQKISRRMRDTVFSVCLIPLNSVMVRFQRLISDLSIELNKEIKFETSGTEIELDKYVIENLVDPLLHLLRNCADHGIEDSTTRVKNGKSKVGLISLTAYISGTHAILEIKDDGAGIDKNKILAKALKLGLADPNFKYHEEDIINFIFHPGFSTAQTVTSVSGRGVGMDVVKKNITKLKGNIAVKSELNQGTQFNIRLPLTLSITEGLLVKVGNSVYVIPLENVIKCVEIKEENLNTVWSYIHYNESQIPILSLQKVFTTSTAFKYPKAVIVNFQNQLVGLGVDEVLGEHQVVLKSLGNFYKDSPEYGGATILGNGQVSLVLDVQRIIQNHLNHQQNQKYGNLN